MTFEYLPRKVSLAVFGTNLTNKHYIVGGYDDADTPTTGLGVAFQNMRAPREWAQPWESNSERLAAQGLGSASRAPRRMYM